MEREFLSAHEYEDINSCVDHADMDNPPEHQLASKVTADPQLEAEKSSSQGTAGGSARAENVRRIEKERRVSPRDFPVLENTFWH